MSCVLRGFLAFDVRLSTPKSKILVRPNSSKKPLIPEMETISFCSSVLGKLYNNWKQFFFFMLAIYAKQVDF